MDSVPRIILLKSVLRRKRTIKKSNSVALIAKANIHLHLQHVQYAKKKQKKLENDSWLPLTLKQLNLKPCLSVTTITSPRLLLTMKKQYLLPFIYSRLFRTRCLQSSSKRLRISSVSPPPSRSDQT